MQLSPNKHLGLIRVSWLLPGIYSLLWYYLMLGHAIDLEQPLQQCLTLGLVIAIYACYWLQQQTQGRQR